VHTRTRPYQKDLFIRDYHMHGYELGYAAKGPQGVPRGLVDVEVHRVDANLMAADNTINFNNIRPTNTDAAVLAKAGPTRQAGVLLEGFEHKPAGEPIGPGGWTSFQPGFANNSKGTPNECDFCHIYFDVLAGFTAGNVNLHSAAGFTYVACSAAHEVGHAVSIDHYAWPDPTMQHAAMSIMVDTLPTWPAVAPQTYDFVDMANLRIHRKH